MIEKRSTIVDQETSYRTTHTTVLGLFSHIPCLPHVGASSPSRCRYHSCQQYELVYLSSNKTIKAYLLVAWTSSFTPACLPLQVHHLAVTIVSDL